MTGHLRPVDARSKLGKVPGGGLSVMEVPLLCVQTGLANFIWDLRDRDIDQPRNLAKSVVVE